MKAEFFKAVCPLEIGDTVAIKTTKDGETKEALYLPQGCTVITTAAVALHKVTDIATLHYLKKGETQFLYELDACGKYEPLTVKLVDREYRREEDQKHSCLKSCKEDFEKDGTLEEQHKRGMKRLEELKTADPVKTFCKNTGATMQLEYKEDGNMTLWYLRFFYKEN